MDVLVTGATGFIGIHLCRVLVERGDSVVALVRSPAKAKLLPKEVRVLQGDLGVFAEPGFVLERFDTVVHLAGVVAASHLEQYEAINFTAVQTLVDCLERQSWAPRRFVFASSLAAAGPSPSDRAWTEEDPLAPIEPYGDAKARAEAVVARASFPTTSFRPCIVLGPNDPASFTLYKAASRGVGLKVGSVAQQLSVVDVRDVVSAIVLMCEDARQGHDTYYVSHPEATNTDALWEALGLAVGRRVRVVPLPKVVLRALVPVMTVASKVVRRTNQLDEKQYKQMVAPAFVCSSAKLIHELGWEPQFTLSETLANAVDGYRKSGALPL